MKNYFFPNDLNLRSHLKLKWLILLFICCKLSSAQEAQSFLVEPGYIFFEMLKNGNQDRMYVIYSSENENKILISCYDQSLKILWQNRHSIISGDQKILFEKFFVFDNKLYQATSIENESNKKNELYVQSYDALGKLSSEKRKLAEMNPESNLKSSMGIKNYIDFNFITSEDGSKLLLSYSDINSIEQNIFLNCKIYNGNLDDVSERKIDIPYLDRKALIDKVELSNKGDVFILTRVSNSDVVVIAAVKDSGFTVNTKYLSYFFHYDTQHSTLTKSLVARSVKTYSPDLEIEGVCGYELDNKTNTVNLFAWAWSENKTNGYNGLYYMLYDINTKKINSDTLIPFKEDIKIKIIGEKETASGSSFSFCFDKTYTFNNGNICLLGHTYSLLKKYKKESSKGNSYRVNELKPKLLFMIISPKGEVINSEVFENHATNPLHYYSFFESTKGNLKIVYRNIAEQNINQDKTSTIEVRSDGTSEHKYQESALTQKLKGEYSGESNRFGESNLIFLDQEFIKVLF